MRPITHGTGNLLIRIVIIDDWSQLPPPKPKFDSAIKAIAKEYALTATANGTIPVIENKREARRNQQPFYRGLKKYKKYA